MPSLCCSPSIRNGAHPLLPVIAAIVLLVPAIASHGANAPDSPMSIARHPDADDYYPQASRSLGETGTVWVRLCYDQAGRVDEANVARSSGFPRLDQAGVRMGRMFRFNPAIVNGRNLPDCAVIPVRLPAASVAVESGPTAGSERPGRPATAMIRAACASCVTAPRVH